MKKKKYYYSKELLQEAYDSGQKIFPRSAIEHSLYLIKDKDKTINNLAKLLNRIERIRCPACNGELSISTGYPDGIIMALCQNAHSGCLLFYYDITNILSQKQMNEKYSNLVGITRNRIHMNRTEIIKQEAEKIRQKLKPVNGILPCLYGEPIDINNPDEVLVASVCIADIENLEKHTKDLNTILCNLDYICLH